VSIRDGLIAAFEGRKVRVRISGDIATIAIKGPRTGIVRPEFEYEIQIADAERMLSTVCGDHLLEKQRFFVEDAAATWHVDVYGGILQGVVIAEIELQQETQELILPPWIGKELTGDSFYKKINMRDRALKVATSTSCASTPCRHRDGGQRDISARGELSAKLEKQAPPKSLPDASWFILPPEGGSPYPPARGRPPQPSDGRHE
jgi:adenylate cyclase